MNVIALLLLFPLLAIITLPWIADRRRAALLSAAWCTVSFVVASYLVYQVFLTGQVQFFFQQWFLCDELAAVFILLNTFIGMTTSFYAISYLENTGRGHLHPLVYRFYHTGYHVFTLSMLVVLLSNSLGIMWVAMELATISSVALVGLNQTVEALEAAWKYLILCSVGIGLALLGTVILYFGAYMQGLGEQGLLWTSLVNIAPLIPSKLLAISFIFMFVGYGTKAGFVPLHNWLPDAHAEGPAPISALLSGLLLNVALFALLRFKWMLAETTIRALPGSLLLLFGFIGLLFASLSLFRQRHLKRLLAYSSIEHISLISIAFGIGTPLALLAGLLHILMHSLAKSAAFFSCGNLIHMTQTQTISKIRGLMQQSPVTAGLFLMSMLAILGLPPSGLFVSELLLIQATLAAHSVLVIPLILGLGLGFLAILFKLQPVFFATDASVLHALNAKRHSCWPIAMHLLLVMVVGILVPLFVLQPVIYSFAGAL